MSKLGQRYIFPFHTPLCSHAENFISLGIITTKIILKVIHVHKTSFHLVGILLDLSIVATGSHLLVTNLQDIMKYMK